MKKLLVVGIIFLFVGVGFQPAFANDISTSIPDDTTPPEVELTYEVYKDEYWMIHFTANCTDDTGIRDVIFTWNGKIAHGDEHEPYEWIVTLDTANGNHICALASDFAGNWEADCLDINVAKEDCDCQSVSDVNLNNKELSNKISTFAEFDEDNQEICDFLEYIFWLLYDFHIILMFILPSLYNEILFNIVWNRYNRTLIRLENILNIAWSLECDWVPLLEVESSFNNFPLNNILKNRIGSLQLS